MRGFKAAEILPREDGIVTVSCEIHVILPSAHPLKRRLVGPQNISGQFGEEAESF